MKAVLYNKYGGPEVLEYKEVEKPIPKDNQVLIRIHSTTVTSADCIMRKVEDIMGRIVLGLRKPRKRFQILFLY